MLLASGLDWVRTELDPGNRVSEKAGWGDSEAGVSADYHGQCPAVPREIGHKSILKNTIRNTEEQG